MAEQLLSSSRSMTAIWESVDSLVKRYFSLDISDVLFEVQQSVLHYDSC